MRRIILAAGLAALGPMLWSAPVRGSATAAPPVAAPVRMMAGEQDGRSTDVGSPANAGDWLWELMLDRLTVPLGPADQNIWPPGSLLGQWIAAADRGGAVGDRPAAGQSGGARSKERTLITAA